MYNIELLKKYLTKLYPYLSKLFYEQKSCICCFLDSEFSYTIRRRFGQIQSILLSDIIKKYEESILREEIHGSSLIPHAEENSKCILNVNIQCKYSFISSKKYQNKRLFFQSFFSGGKKKLNT